jgi:hypothetical protein
MLIGWFLPGACRGGLWYEGSSNYITMADEFEAAADIPLRPVRVVWLALPRAASAHQNLSLPWQNPS